MKNLDSDLNGHGKNSTGKYVWPSSQIGEYEMRLLYYERERTGKPITILIKEAVSIAYGCNHSDKIISRNPG